MYKLIIGLLIFFLSTTPFASPQKVQDIWIPVAEHLCGQINQAALLYEQGDSKKAHLLAVMSYFKSYDAEMEPAVRITLGGAHVFTIERQFRDLAAATSTLKPDKKEINAVKDQSKKLCEALKQDAQVLNENKVERQVFKVN